MTDGFEGRLSISVGSGAGRRVLRADVHQAADNRGVQIVRYEDGDQRMGSEFYGDHGREWEWQGRPQC